LSEGERPARGAVSIVVPARDASATIEQCLRSILDDLPPDDRDVVVVDNGSVDDTPALARRFPVRVEVVSDGFVSACRNAGARVARHAVIGFVDADCTVRRGWHRAALAALSPGDVGIAGARHEIPAGSSWVGRAWDQAHRRRIALPELDVPYVPAGNLAMRRELFMRAGGFDEALEAGEDPDLCARIASLGYRVVQARDMRCVHLGEPRTLRAVFRRQRWHGRGARLRYHGAAPDAIMVSTAAFAAGLATAAAIVPRAVATRQGARLALLPLPLVVPLVYAARYARGPRHFLQLLPIYTAYFLGRAVALPTVGRREMRTRAAA
jgi:GT2 family glycosyltransferase